MTTIHVFRAVPQPATEFRVPGLRGAIRASGYALAWCVCCRERRRLRGMVALAYYDKVDYRCAPGFGCQRAA